MSTDHLIVDRHWLLNRRPQSAVRVDDFTYHEGAVQLTHRIVDLARGDPPPRAQE